MTSLLLVVPSLPWADPVIPKQELLLEVPCPRDYLEESGAPQSGSSGRWLAVTDEGTWLAAGWSTVFLQGIQPSGLLAQLGLVGGAQLLSLVPGSEKLANWGLQPGPTLSKWLGRAGPAVGLGSMVWHLSEALDKSGWLPGSYTVPVAVSVPEVSSRLLFQMQFSEEQEGAVLAIVRNPLYASGPLVHPIEAGVRSQWAQVALDLDRIMASQAIERINIEMYAAPSGLGLNLGWRRDDQAWRWFNLDGVIHTQSDSVWLGHQTTSATVQVLTPLQTPVLALIAEILAHNRATDYQELTVEPPAYNISGHKSSLLLDTGEYPVVLDARYRGNTLISLELNQVGIADAGVERIWQLPEAWTATGRAVVSLALTLAMGAWLKPWNPLELGLLNGCRGGSGPGGRTMATRLQLLQAGKAVSTGAAMAVTRRIAGKPHVVRVGHSGRLKDSNFINLSEKLTRELLTTVDFPWNFELTGKGGRKAWVVDDGNRFSKHDDEILMSEHVMNRLNIRKGERVSLQPVRLNMLTDLSVSIVGGDTPLNDDQILSLLASALDKRYWILHRDEIIRTRYQGENYAFKVENIHPAGAAFNGRKAQINLHVIRPERWERYIPKAMRAKQEVPAFWQDGRLLQTGERVRADISQSGATRDAQSKAGGDGKKFGYQVSPPQATGYRD